MTRQHHPGAKVPAPSFDQHAGSGVGTTALRWTWVRAPSPVRTLGRLLRAASIRAARELLPARLPRNPDGKVYIHLGCGYVDHPAFINVDALVAWHVHYIRPIDDLRPLPDNYAD